MKADEYRVSGQAPSKKTAERVKTVLNRLQPDIFYISCHYIISLMVARVGQDKELGEETYG
jgi:hypothetical protein